MNDEYTKKAKWFLTHIGYLDEHADYLRKAVSKPIRKSGSWGLLKLLTLGYVIPTYTTVASKYFNFTYYVDLFAGNGLNLIKRSSDDVLSLGSPFVTLANKNVKTPFDHYFFVDENEENANALKLRLDKLTELKEFEWLKDIYTVINKDANDAVHDILLFLKNLSNDYRVHGFWFIDPNSMELSWKAMNSICTSTSSDLLINIMKSEIFQAISSFHSSPTPNTPALDTWWGDQTWKSITKRDQISPQYIQRISTIKDSRKRPRSEIMLLPINALQRNKTESYYDLVYMAASTGLSNPWMRAFDKLQENLIDANDKFVDTLLDILHLKQQQLDDDWY